MSKKSLLIVTMLMTMGATGRLWAQSQALTMSLEQLFQTADLHNTSIKSFDAAIREAEAGIKAAKAERLPDVDASVAFSYLGGGCIMDRDFSNGVGVHIPHYGNNFALTASMPIYAGGAITSGINLSRLAADMAKANASDNQQRVRMMLAAYYLFSHFLNDDTIRQPAHTHAARPLPFQHWAVHGSILPPQHDVRSPETNLRSRHLVQRQHNAPVPLARHSSCTHQRPQSSLLACLRNRNAEPSPSSLHEEKNS